MKQIYSYIAYKPLWWKNRRSYIEEFNYFLDKDKIIVRDKHRIYSTKIDIQIKKKRLWGIFRCKLTAEQVNSIIDSISKVTQYRPLR